MTRHVRDLIECFRNVDGWQFETALDSLRCVLKRVDGGLCGLLTFAISEFAPCQSPVLGQLTIVFKHGLGLCFGEIVGSHLIGGTLNDSELFVVVPIPKPVPFREEILGSGGDLLVGCQEVGTLVVLKHGSVQLEGIQLGCIHFVHDLQD